MDWYALRFKTELLWGLTMANKYKLEIDFLDGHKIINKETNTEYLITQNEILSFIEYANGITQCDIPYSNAVRHIDNYLENIIA